jgi:hypothetical protein
MSGPITLRYARPPERWRRRRRILLALPLVSAVATGCFPQSADHPQRTGVPAEASPVFEARPQQRGEVQLAEDWRIVSTPLESYSLVFRDGSSLMVLDAGEDERRLVQTRHERRCFWDTPVWSADGKFMFDCETQVFALATDTGDLRTLTSYPVSRAAWRDGWRAGWPKRRPTGEAPRFVHDPAGNRLFVVTVPNTPRPKQKELTELLAIDLSDGSHRVVLDGDALQEKIGCWALSLEHQRFYGATKTGVAVWSLGGKKIREVKCAPVRARNLSLSPDGKMLLAERFVRGRWGKFSLLGWWLLDAESLEVKHELDWGHSLRWSSHGDRIAFLKLSEELWILNVQDKSLERLACVSPPAGAPDWSRFRYYACPAWSRDDRMLACGLATYVGGYHDYNSYTLLLDLRRKEARVVPEYWTHLSWSPVARPFVRQRSDEE